MNKKYIVSFLFIIVGAIVAIYFFVFGWYLVGGFGCGLVWGGVELLNSITINIFRDEIVNENGENYVKIDFENISFKKGEVSININLLEENKIVCSLMSEVVYVMPKSQGVVKIKIPSVYDDIKKIRYEITRIITKKC